jgi:hypothetical protein
VGTGKTVRRSTALGGSGEGAAGYGRGETMDKDVVYEAAEEVGWDTADSDMRCAAAGGRDGETGCGSVE